MGELLGVADRGGGDHGPARRSRGDRRRAHASRPTPATTRLARRRDCADAGARDRQRLRPQPRRVDLGGADRTGAIGDRIGAGAGDRVERLCARAGGGAIDPLVRNRRARRACARRLRARRRGAEHAGRRQPAPARAVAISVAADEDRHAGGLGGPAPAGGAGADRDRLCERLRQRPLGLYPAQRRRARGRAQGAGGADRAARRTSSSTGSRGSATRRSRVPTGSRCCATPTATASPTCAPCSSTISIAPFGVALVGGDALRRQHRRDRALPLPDRPDADHRGGIGADRPPRRADRPSLDQEPGGEPRRDQALRRHRLELERHRERDRGGEGPRAHLGGRPCDRRAPALRHRAFAIPTGSPSCPAPTSCGPSSTSATSWGRTSSPITSRR